MGAATAPACECPPGTRCIPCTTGTLQVNVYLQTVCWDTDRTLGVNSPDRPFTGVMVTVWDGGTRIDSKMTDSTGVAMFDALDAGEVGGSGKDYDYMISKEGFEDKTDDVQFDPDTQKITPLRAHIDVHQTTHALRVLRRTGMECTRKHSAPTPSSVSGLSLGPIFWSHEPWLLVLRDLLWVLSGTAALIVGIAGFAAAPQGTPFMPGAIASAAICLAYFGYFGGVIFGIAFGIPAILVAFAAFLVIAVLAIISAAAPSFLHLPPPDPWGFPILAGTWVGIRLWMDSPAPLRLQLQGHGKPDSSHHFRHLGSRYRAGPVFDPARPEQDRPERRWPGHSVCPGSHRRCVVRRRRGPARILFCQ